VALVWDDLQCLLAVQRAGSIGAASRLLKVDPSTVSRRLAALEAALGVQLVTRTPEGVKITEAGAQAVASAESIETKLGELVARIGGSDTKPEGSVRVSVTDGFAAFLYRGLALLRQEHPGICAELLISSNPADLSRGEADIAVRFFRESSGDLVARKVATLGWALYASESYIERRGAPDPTHLDAHDLIGFSDTAARSAGARWLDASTKPSAIVLRATSVIGAMKAVKAGIGVTLLPCFYAHGEPSIRRCSTELLADNEVFIVMTADQKNTARVRIVADALIRLFTEEKKLLSGT
jgi:DNA-binding transcriptional LysR family regulator